MKSRVVAITGIWRLTIIVVIVFVLGWTHEILFQKNPITVTAAIASFAPQSTQLTGVGNKFPTSDALMMSQPAIVKKDNSTPLECINKEIVRSPTDQQIYFQSYSHFNFHVHLISTLAGFLLLSILGLVCSRYHINRLKAAEKALKASEHRLSLALKAAKAGIWQWDKVLNKVIWSDENYQLLGYCPKSCDPKYKNWLKAVHPEDRQWADNYMKQLLSHKKDIDLEYRVLLPDGTVRWLADLGEITYDEAGNQTGMIGIQLDITQRKQSEETLQKLNQELEIIVQQRTAELEEANAQLQQEIAERQQTQQQLFKTQQRLQHLLSNNPAVIYSCQASGDYRATFVSTNSIALVGYEAEEFLTHPNLWIDNVHPDDLPRVLTQLSQLHERGYLNYEYRFQHKNGSYRWMQDELKFIQDEEGNSTELIGYWIDITERKQAEAEILYLNEDLENCVKKRTEELEKLLVDLSERTVQLETLNQELDSFSYSVSHDLRAPLRHINGFVHALKRELKNSNILDNPKVNHYLEIIDESSQKMGQLIDGLLTLCRVGRRKLIFSTVALQPLVETAINLVSSSQNTEKLKFKIGNLPTVKGDSTLLQQVFVNLIDNAVKFSQDRSPAIIEIDCLPDKTIFVKDNGVGFSMEYADQLFGAFQRLHSQQQFKGNGIGLSIVQRIIHRHGGKIWADSELDKGATFYFKFD